jgi:ABC-type polysaccharide/polyol phosphate transport system ATPase subunit
MTVVIRGEGLGKRYRRGVVESAGMLRDSLARFARSPLAALRRPNHEEFWALRDVDLEVKEGEVLGLIGRNGAGKTTLLKVLSRITRPSTGWAEIHGRVRSLLEVGTGFHGELTGRENTYLSGSILGMSKREISRKFDEIVAFAEIEKFIDTPVKHYSSGMYVRLAFAVAAHLEPEILLVDEVLAVGDINFQKKCLGKMGDVARAGRTVVLVSHQMNQIRRLCNRVVWVDGGSIRMTGETQRVVSDYEAAMRRNSGDGNRQSRSHSGKGQFLDWGIASARTGDPYTLADLEPLTIRMRLALNEELRDAVHGLALYNHEQQLVWAWNSQKLCLAAGEHELRHTFPMLPVRPGLYNWLATLYDGFDLVDWWHCGPEMVVSAHSYQSTFDAWHGILNMPSKFEVVELLQTGVVGQIEMGT